MQHAFKGLLKTVTLLYDFDEIKVNWREDAHFNKIDLTEDKVKKVIRKLKMGKAPGFDTLSNSYFKELANELARPLLSLFQRVLSHSERCVLFLRGAAFARMLRDGGLCRLAVYR